MKRIALCLLLVLCAGCNTWERTTFQTLSSSKAVIDQAATDYQNRTIANTTCNFTTINNARAAQTTAVNSMVVYEQLKATGGNFQAQVAVVTADLATLPALVVSLQAIISNPTKDCGGTK